MGLTAASTGKNALAGGNRIARGTAEKVIALAGNPNVGKSTVFNALTGLRQHTGNWAGKTVAGAQGSYVYRGREYILADIPGAYSLMAMSAEEEAARDILCFGGADMAVVVCDAACLERNLNLVLQTLEITPNVIVAVNLMDEAEKRGVRVDVRRLSAALGVPAVGMSALKGEGIDDLTEAIRVFPDLPGPVCRVRYPEAVEKAAAVLEMPLANLLLGRLDDRWVSLRLLEGDEKLLSAVDGFLGFPLRAAPEIAAPLEKAQAILAEAGLAGTELRDAMVAAIYERAEAICAASVSRDTPRNDRQLRADRVLTSRFGGGAVMLIMLAAVFFITIKGANAVSDVLYGWLGALGDVMSRWLLSLSPPAWLHDALIFGVWRVLSWVTSVMLPPMAIFFPLFTLLEDLGYLPRVAFCLDDRFRRCGACGKQALTMCMGFGCNAAGVTGCRIIDSPRERLIAILTNSLVPCNGRFPLLIALITLFFVGGGGFAGSALSSLALTAVVLLGAGLTFLVSSLLSKTLLRGVPSSLTLEMPPFRKPQVGRILVRSVLDRTVFVLGRAAVAAAPAGLLIWLAANVTVNGQTILSAVTGFLDPFGRVLGLDGVILAAFILGIPANEIVLPIIIMAYAAEGVLTGYSDLSSLRELLVMNGWTWRTALCVTLFSLSHWPCAATLMTVKKETGSLRWTAAAFIIPTACGILMCLAANLLTGLF